MTFKLERCGLCGKIDDFKRGKYIPVVGNSKGQFQCFDCLKKNQVDHSLENLGAKNERKKSENQSKK